MGTVIIGKIASLILLLNVVVLNCFVEIRSMADPILPPQEVAALDAITDKLDIGEWESSGYYCINAGLKTNRNRPEGKYAKVLCDCSFENGTLCHVTEITFKRLSLYGEIPHEFGNLNFLQRLNLTDNYLNGTIPTSLARLPLVSLVLGGNRLTGSIPEFLGNISTLEILILEDNLLGGPLPPSLGNLSLLKSFTLTANNFTGQIPESFGNFKNLEEFRADGNTFSGKLPSFIGNWTKLNKLNLQGTSMEGPIPSTVSLLKNLTELMITDLMSGPISTFPNLLDMKAMKTLVLRNCHISGSVPDYIGNMTSLRTLDLSFNQLSGPIPLSIQNLDNLVYVFLTNNSLTGDIPDNLLNSKMRIDLSYNNFTNTNISSGSLCQQSTVNLASSYPSNENSVNWCLKKGLPCSHKPNYYSLFINCGGPPVRCDGNDYSDDSSDNGKSYFSSDSQRWAFSSTGLFLGEDDASNIATNVYSLNITGPEYYQNARQAAVSLRYYGLCLMKGNYKVKLHFAEIMYTDDQTYRSLGKRLFDVYIQGKRYLKDFNIAKEAGGVGKNITKEYDVGVYETTLEIHLYWAGKGTTALPERGVYGPLISAISVTPNFNVTTGDDSGRGLSRGAIAGIVISSLVIFALIFLILLQMNGYLRVKDLQNSGRKTILKLSLVVSLTCTMLITCLVSCFMLKKRDKKRAGMKSGGVDMEVPFCNTLFNFATISAATQNFSKANVLGVGGFGTVYKGNLLSGEEIAVKRLSQTSKQGIEEFKNEINLIGQLQHKNLVGLLGICIQKEEQMLIYEYMSNKSLDYFIFDDDKKSLLPWPKRFDIVKGIARGLLYLHRDSKLQIIHRDLKAANILLDDQLNPKISDFGLARLFGGQKSSRTKRVVGTYGYMSPEYAVEGIISEKSDVFSFGVLLLEIVSGKRNRGFHNPDNFLNLSGHAWLLWREDRALELMDASLMGESCVEFQINRCIHIGLLCVQKFPDDRPTMSSVLSMLEHEDMTLPKPKVPGFFIERSHVDESSTSHPVHECSVSDSAKKLTITTLGGR